MTEPLDQWFVLGINPEPWVVGPVGVNRHGGKISAYVGRSQQLDSYKQAVAESVNLMLPRMHTGPVSLTVYFWRARSEYTTPQSRTHRKHEADATNMLKATEDALQDILYKNDKDNHHVQAFIVEQNESTQPCIVIHTQDYTGIGALPEDVWKKIEGAQSHLPLEVNLDWGEDDQF